MGSVEVLGGARLSSRILKCPGVVGCLLAEWVQGDSQLQEARELLIPPQRFRTSPNQIRKETIRFWSGCPQRGWAKLQTSGRSGGSWENRPARDDPEASIFLAIEPGLE